MDLMIAIAESCTGGLVSAALTEIPGSSAVLDRGFVTYSYPSKTELLGVSPDILAQFGAVSEEAASQMAKGAIEASNAQVAVSITGVAGPGGSNNKPEGLVFFGLSSLQTKQIIIKKEFGAIGRSNVRLKSVETALNMLLRAVDA